MQSVGTGQGVGIGTGGVKGGGQYSGSGGLANPVGSPSLRETICREPLAQGSCTAAVPRYWYNSQSGYCEPFLFSGCRGNNNNFKSYESCMVTCRGQNLPPPPQPRRPQFEPQQPQPPPCFDVGQQPEPPLSFAGGVNSPACELELETGYCAARTSRFGYNTKTGRCEEFYFSGCGGNANAFQSEQECLAMCPLATGVDRILNNEVNPQQPSQQPLPLPPTYGSVQGRRGVKGGFNYTPGRIPSQW